MTEPTTPTGRRYWEERLAGSGYAIHKTDILAIETEAREPLLALLEEAREALQGLGFAMDTELAWHHPLDAPLSGHDDKPTRATLAKSRALLARLPQPPRRQWRDDPDDRS